MKILRLSSLISLLYLSFLHSLLQTELVPPAPVPTAFKFPPHVIQAPRRAHSHSDTFQMLAIQTSSDCTNAKTLLRLYLKLTLIFNNFRLFSDCYDFLPFSNSSFFQIAKTLLIKNKGQNTQREPYPGSAASDVVNIDEIHTICGALTKLYMLFMQ